jgi:hypothetical protein
MTGPAHGTSDGVPAGWYPAPQGGQRYWDGQRWLALPEPDDTAVYPADEVTGAGRMQNATGGRKTILIAAAIAMIVLVAAGIAGLVWKNGHDTDMHNAAVAASSSKAAAAAAQAEADRIQRETAAKRAERATTVTEIEAAVKQMAEKHVADGLFDGPILSVSCSPVGGGSTDDLTAKTTIFECFAATTDNGDGTMMGRKYHATMNWDAGTYTYGLGAPG